MNVFSHAVDVGRASTYNISLLTRLDATTLSLVSTKLTSIKLTSDTDFGMYYYRQAERFERCTGTVRPAGLAPLVSATVHVRQARHRLSRLSDDVPGSDHVVKASED